MTITRDKAKDLVCYDKNCFKRTNIVGSVWLAFFSAIFALPILFYTL